MASKQQTREAQERLDDLRLRAAIRAGAPTGGDEIFRSNDSGAGDQNLWNQLKAEEIAEQEKERLNSPYLKLLRAQWRKPLEQIMKEKTYSLALFLDPLAELPMTSNPAESDFTKAESLINNDLDEVLEPRGIVLSRTGKLRTMIYGGMQSDTVTVLNGVESRGAVSKLQYWIACVNRLAAIDAYDESEYVAIPEAEQQPAPVETTEDLREIADSQWLRIFGTIYREWLASLAQSPWNFTPDEEQQRAALKYLEQRGQGTPLAFDNCRIAMSDAGIFPHLYTVDDLIVKKLESGAWDLSTPSGRNAYQKAKNQAIYGTLGD